MIEIEIGYQNRKRVFKIQIQNKFTLLRGESSTGKSWLCNLVSAVENRVPGYYIKGLPTNCEVLYIPTNSKILTSTDKIPIYFIDEESVFFSQKDVGKILNSTNAYFILINRSNLGYLPIDVRSVLNLVNSGKYSSAVQDYKKPKTEKNIIPNGFDLILTEDSKSSFLFFNSLKNIGKIKQTTEIISSNGASLFTKKIMELIKSGNYKSVLLVYDSSAFENYYESLFSYLKNIHIQWVLLDWLSFEQYLLRNNIFNIDIQESGYLYNSVEQKATTILSELIHYSKISLGCLSPETVCTKMSYCSPNCLYKHFTEDFYIHSELKDILNQSKTQQTNLFS